jgi:hypothetical protein
MEKTKQSFIARVKTYLRKAELPYARIPDTENLLVLRSAGSHHYLLIKFYNMPDNWLETRKYFDIKVVEGKELIQVTKAIEKYLRGE